METLVIQSNKQEMAFVEDFLSNVCDQQHLNNYFATISVAVLQAVENAIVYGNRCDASKSVQITCGSCSGGIFFEVVDQGEGFDHSGCGLLPDEEGRGEGLFLIKVLADEVEFSNDGRSIRLEFYISGIELSVAEARMGVLQQFFQPKALEA